jgi:hypothetical protein
MQHSIPSKPWHIPVVAVSLSIADPNTYLPFLYISVPIDQSRAFVEEDNHCFDAGPSPGRISGNRWGLHSAYRINQNRMPKRNEEEATIKKRMPFSLSTHSYIMPTLMVPSC